MPTMNDEGKKKKHDLATKFNINMKPIKKYNAPA